MNSLLPDLITGVVGFAILGASYAGFKAQWPGSYRNLADTFDLPANSYAWRVFVFRTLPVFLASLLIWRIADEFGGSGWLAVLLTMVGHIATSNGKALFETFRGRTSVNYALHHLTASLLAGLGAVGALLAAPHMRDFIPNLSELTDAIWTALLVAVLGAFLVRATSGSENGHSLNPEYLFERAVRDAGRETFDEIYQTSIRYQVDPLLVTAVAASEILQRPRWFRRFERILGGRRKQGTYGVMQMSAPKPISDKRSIELFCERNRGAVCFRYDPLGYLETDRNAIWAIAGAHSGGDRAFIDSVTTMYCWLAQRTEWPSALPPEKSLGALDQRKYPTEWGLRFATTASQITVITYPSRTNLTRERPAGVAPGNWWYVEYTCAISDHEGLLTMDEAKHITLNLSVTPGGYGLFRDSPVI